MTKLSNSILLLTAALVWCIALSANDGTSNELDRILKHFPGYHLLTLQERDSDTRAFIVRHFPRDNPSLIRADFDGDGHLDYAMLLRDNKSGSTKFVVLLCAADGDCKSVYDVDETADAGGVYLRPVRMGSRVSETEAINGNGKGPETAKLFSTGIEVTYFEKATVVLYWNGKLRKIQEIQTED